MNTEKDFPNIRIGTDLVEIKRFRELDRDSNFVKRIYSQIEIEYCYSYSDPAPHLASTFAGKEAVVKALRVSKSLGLQSIEILRDEDGVPNVKIPKEYACCVSISLTHTSEYAAAVALILSSENVKGSMSTQKLLNDTCKKILPDE